MKWYFVNLLFGIDQLFNCIIAGYHDETISSRAGKWIRKNSASKGHVWYWLCWMLEWVDKNHCIDAIEDDEGWPTIKPTARWQYESDEIIRQIGDH